jgi:hypothetical protein
MTWHSPGPELCGSSGDEHCTVGCCISEISHRVYNQLNSMQRKTIQPRLTSVKFLHFGTIKGKPSKAVHSCWVRVCRRLWWNIQLPDVQAQIGMKCDTGLRFIYIDTME